MVWTFFNIICCLPWNKVSSVMVTRVNQLDQPEYSGRNIKIKNKEQMLSKVPMYPNIFPAYLPQLWVRHTGMSCSHQLFTSTDQSTPDYCHALGLQLLLLWFTLSQQSPVIRSLIAVAFFKRNVAVSFYPLLFSSHIRQTLYLPHYITAVTLNPSIIENSIQVNSVILFYLTIWYFRWKNLCDYLIYNETGLEIPFQKRHSYGASKEQRAEKSLCFTAKEKKPPWHQCLYIRTREPLFKWLCL